MDRRNSPIREFLDHVRDQDTLHASDADDLKIEGDLGDGIRVRVWRSRMRVEDGARVHNAVTVEMQLEPNPVWFKVGAV